METPHILIVDHYKEIRDLLGVFRQRAAGPGAAPRPAKPLQPATSRGSASIAGCSTFHATRCSMRPGEEMALGTAEFRLLLQAFVTQPGMGLNRDQLLDITAGRAAQIFDRSIDNLVSRLRKRIERDPQQPTIIKAVWGGGYMFAAAVETML